MKKYIVFDFDGTLADSEKVAFHVINELADRHGFPKMDLKQMVKLKSQGETFQTFSQIATEYYRLYKEYLYDIKLFDGILEMLYELRDSGNTIVVISSNEESNIREYFQKNRVDFIEEIYTSSDLLGKAKMIEDLCERHNLCKSEVIYVGDEIRDIQASLKSRVEVIWVSWGFDTAEIALKENPTYVANTPADIVRLVKG